MTPQPFVSLTANHLTIVGKTSAPMVEVYMNDLKVNNSYVTDSVFHIPLNFGYGLFTVKVVPIESGMSDSEAIAGEIEILCGPMISKRAEKLYPKYIFHSPDENKDCSGCHQNNPGSADSKEGKSQCVGCHRNFSERRLLHTSMNNEDCFTCHNPETSQASSSTSKYSGTNPCYSCHTDKIKKFDQEYVHGPVAGGSCAVCHDPHGSQYEKSLVKTIEILCYTCHEFSRDQKELPVQHIPFMKGNCTSCHNPHAASGKWVLSKSSELLCAQCHDPNKPPLVNHTHPYNVKPKDSGKIDLKLSSAGKLECLTCHNPHAGKSEHLLRSDQQFACLGCHKDIQ